MLHTATKVSPHSKQNLAFPPSTPQALQVTMVSAVKSVQREGKAKRAFERKSEESLRNLDFERYF